MTIPRYKEHGHQNTCRLCGKKIRKGVHIFRTLVERDDKSEAPLPSAAQSLAALIYDCLRLKVTEDDLLPKQVCCDCEKKLTSWFSFYSKSRETQDVLLKAINLKRVPVVQRRPPSPTATVTKAEAEPNEELPPQEITAPEPPQEDNTPQADAKNETAELCDANVEACSSNSESNAQVHTCPVCQKTFSHRNKFAQHLALHVTPEEDSQLWPCPVCPKKLRSCDGLARHQETHLESRNFCCHVCGRLFQTLTCLLNHLRVQHSPESGPGARPRHACPICGRVFRQSTHMSQHLRTHTGERPYWCRECGSRFTTSGQLQRHTQAVHQGLKRFKCDLCGKEFLYSHNYKAHLQRHEGNKDLSCDLCEKSFFTKNALFRHRRFHTGEKPFQCDVCGKKFADCSNRKRHRQQHHKDVPEGQVAAASSVFTTPGTVQVLLMDQQEDADGSAEGGKTFTSLRTFFLDDMLHVELLPQERGAEGAPSGGREGRPPGLVTVVDESELAVAALRPLDLPSEMVEPPFTLEPMAPVDLTSPLDADSPVDLSASLHSMARSPLHIPTSPSRLSPTHPLDLSPGLQPMAGSPLHIPNSDFLLTLHSY